MPPDPVARPAPWADAPPARACGMEGPESRPLDNAPTDRSLRRRTPPR